MDLPLLPQCTGISVSTKKGGLCETEGGWYGARETEVGVHHSSSVFSTLG